MIKYSVTKYFGGISMKKVKTNAMRLLEEASIPYTLHTYDMKHPVLTPELLAKDIDRDVHLIYKTLVTKSHSGQHYVFCLPLVGELDLKKAAKAAGEKSVELIDQKDLLKLTGYERGGVSPVGMKKQYPTFLHEGCLLLSTIIVSAGKRGFQVEVDPKRILPLLSAETADLLAETKSIFK